VDSINKGSLAPGLNGDTAIAQDWLSSPRDALPAKAPPEASRCKAPVRAAQSAGRAGPQSGSKAVASPRRRPGEEQASRQGLVSRTPSAAAMRAGRKFSEASKALSPSARRTAPEAVAPAKGGSHDQAPRKGLDAVDARCRGPGGAPKRRPEARPVRRPTTPGKWAWKEQDIRMMPEVKRTSSPRRSEGAKVRMPGAPSARVVAALDGPQGLMSLVGRLAPEASVASTPTTPSGVAVATPAFSGGDDFRPADWATHLRQGRPASPLARSKSQGALRRAWSPVGPCTSPKWQPSKSTEKVSPRVPPPPTRLMAGPSEIGPSGARQ